MARKPEEIVFSDALGAVCEHEIAPVLLARLSDPATELIDLNQRVKANHKWADWAFLRGGDWHVVAVRGRVRWEKPNPNDVRSGYYRPRVNSSFNGQGERLRREGVESVRHFLRLPGREPVQSIWLSIAVDIDGTYDAYWGPDTEMREIKRERESDEPGLAVAMSRRDVWGYTQADRRLAFRRPHVFPWHLGDHWACTARTHWLQLTELQDRDERIAVAIHATASELALAPSTAPPLTDAREIKPFTKKLANPSKLDLSPADARSTGMALRVTRGDLPRESLCLLRVLASDTPKWWSMSEIAEGMRTQVAEGGNCYISDRYNETARALDIAGLVITRKPDQGRGLLRKITSLGMSALQGGDN